jgi:hypothetical protein
VTSTVVTVPKLRSTKENWLSLAHCYLNKIKRIRKAFHADASALKTSAICNAGWVAAAKLVACSHALKSIGISFPFLNSDNSSAGLVIAATTSAH